MANKGFALYKRDNNLYILSVAYEYGISKFVGFDENGELYKIGKLNDTQKEWLKTHNPKLNEKTKSLIFIDDYYLTKSLFNNFPKGKMYTQLPGGGGIYKETRKYNSIYDLFANKVFLKSLERHGSFNENFDLVKKTIKKVINEDFQIKKINQESPNIEFTAVSIENEIDKNKINDIFYSLQKEGKIPKNFKRPTFKNGDFDYHMTITLGELPLSLKRDLDKNVSLNVETIGISNLAVALGVYGDYLSKNKFQHITIAFYDAPINSKFIVNWIPLETPFKINGIIREFSTKKKIVKRRAY
jgi:hypothetical protein